MKPCRIEAVGTFVDVCRHCGQEWGYVDSNNLYGGPTENSFGKCPYDNDDEDMDEDYNW